MGKEKGGNMVGKSERGDGKEGKRKRKEKEN